MPTGDSPSFSSPGSAEQSLQNEQSVSQGPVRTSQREVRARRRDEVFPERAAVNVCVGVESEMGRREREGEGG